MLPPGYRLECIIRTTSLDPWPIYTGSQFASGCNSVCCCWPSKPYMILDQHIWRTTYFLMKLALPLQSFLEDLHWVLQPSDIRQMETWDFLITAPWNSLPGIFICVLLLLSSTSQWKPFWFHLAFPRWSFIPVQCLNCCFYVLLNILALFLIISLMCVLGGLFYYVSSFGGP